MLRQLRVLAVPIGIAALTAAPALANEAVVLVGCDLLAGPAPRAIYRQSGGDSSFGLRGDDARGRDCAEVLAEVAAMGLEFREFRTTGLNFSVGIWFWERPVNPTENR